MQTRVCRKQSKCHPTVVDVWRRVSLDKVEFCASPDGSGLTSKPPMSWDEKANPDDVKLRHPRKASAIASNVDSQSPPQCLSKNLLTPACDAEKILDLPLETCLVNIVNMMQTGCGATHLWLPTLPDLANTTASPSPKRSFSRLNTSSLYSTE